MQFTTAQQCVSLLVTEKNMYVMFDPDGPKNRLVALPWETLTAFWVLACLIQMVRQPLNS